MASGWSPEGRRSEINLNGIFGFELKSTNQNFDPCDFLTSLFKYTIIGLSRQYEVVSQIEMVYKPQPLIELSRFAGRIEIRSIVILSVCQVYE